MIVVGADVHKRTHTFVAVDEIGKELGQLPVAADGKGQDKALTWAHREFGADLKWGIEDCRHLSARLEIDLLTATTPANACPLETARPRPCAASNADSPASFSTTQDRHTKHGRGWTPGRRLT